MVATVPERYGTCSHTLTMSPELLAILRCPRCAGMLTILEDDNDCHLTCDACGETFQIAVNIPRILGAQREETARRTQDSFGYEWTHFNDWTQSGQTNFNDYFQGVDLLALKDCAVLDAGCGMGRHTRQIAAYARSIVAVDFSMAIEQAALNTSDLPNVECVQADLLALPFADNAFEFVYSLGVLHHLAETERALASLVRKLKPGGRLRVYLYWKRHGWKGRVLSAVTAARKVTTRMPFPALRTICRLLSLGLFGGVVLPYRALSAVGVRGLDDWPLFVYTKYPFNVLYNDQFDRFSAPIEKRYDDYEVRALLEGVGLSDVKVRPCFGWIADGIKPR